VYNIGADSAPDAAILVPYLVAAVNGRLPPLP
jgi:hypothetical protein